MEWSGVVVDISFLFLTGLYIIHDGAWTVYL